MFKYLVLFALLAVAFVAANPGAAPEAKPTPQFISSYGAYSPLAYSAYPYAGGYYGGVYYR